MREVIRQVAANEVAADNGDDEDELVLSGARLVRVAVPSEGDAGRRQHHPGFGEYSDKRE